MEHRKLVRDNILEIIEQNGGKAESRIADDSEYEVKLGDKLEEEVHELREASGKEKKEEELADVQQVLDAIIEYYGLSAENIKAIKEKKLKERGGFKKRIILETSE